MTDLRDIRFFDKLNDEEIGKIKQISTQKKYKKGEILFYEGDEPKHLYVLLGGILKIYKTDSRAHQVFLHQLFPVNFVAELANFEGIAYPATAEFTSDGEVLKIDYEKFLNEFMTNPQLSLNLVKSLSNKLKILSEVLHKELVLSSEAKIAKFIVENSEIFSMTKNVNIASLLNITPETLSRTLTKFKKDDFIQLDKQNKFTKINEEKLKQLYM